MSPDGFERQGEFLDFHRFRRAPPAKRLTLQQIGRAAALAERFLQASSGSAHLKLRIGGRWRALIGGGEGAGDFGVRCQRPSSASGGGKHRGRKDVCLNTLPAAAGRARVSAGLERASGYPFGV